MPKINTKLIIALIIILVSIIGIVVGIILVRQRQDIEPSASGISCPIEPTATSQTIILNRRMSAKVEERSTAGPIPVSIAPGKYNITLVSWDSHSEKPDQVQPEEVYLLQLLGDTGAVVAQTNPSQDIPQSQDIQISQVNTELEITQHISSLTVVHPIFPNGNANSLDAVCVSFASVSEPTPSPSPSPSPTPSPSPSPSISPSPSPTSNPTSTPTPTPATPSPAPTTPPVGGPSPTPAPITTLPDAGIALPTIAAATAGIILILGSILLII